MKKIIAAVLALTVPLAACGPATKAESDPCQGAANHAACRAAVEDDTDDALLMAAVVGSAAMMSSSTSKSYSYKPSYRSSGYSSFRSSGFRR